MVCTRVKDLPFPHVLSEIAICVRCGEGVGLVPCAEEAAALVHSVRFDS